ncbi:MAG: nucleoside hydrolase [Paracoccaceae bacterium]|nr:nucleoside hydrolase [Paracoccaceae bacterium]
MIKLIIDTDPGVDDAMAILYAAAHPKLELIGLTSVFGNVPVATATRNALWLAELARLGIPVAEGAAVPLEQPLRPHPDFVHGIEGFGHLPPVTPSQQPDPRSAAQFLSETCAASPGEVTICAIGPLSNLAAALALDPAIVRNAAQVVVMGGALETPGNVNEHAEANIWNDPDAAAKVFAADWPVTLVGLDITEVVHCGPDDFARVARNAPVIGGFLNDAVQFYFDFHRARHDIDGCHMHDPTAVITLTDPGLFEYREAPVQVTLDGETAGRTSFGGDCPAARVAMGVEAQSVLAEFLDTIGQADTALGLRQS